MIAIAVLAALAPQRADSFARVQTLQLESGQRAIASALADLDGDGEREVVIATRNAKQRALAIWKNAQGSAAFAASETLPLTADVVAWATGDVREGGGDEIILFNARGAFSWQWGAPPEKRIERLADAEFLWQIAETSSVFLWQEGVRDLDGDGLVDLVLPEPDGFVLALQRRPREKDAPWGVARRVRVPVEMDEDGVWISASTREGPSMRGKRSERSLSLQIGNGEDDDESRLLVQVNESVPAPQWLDWDADGDLDLVAQTSKRLCVWRQDAGGAFTADPTFAFALPVEAGRERRLDASYSSHTADLDQDHRADCVIFAGDKRSDEVRTQALVFLQGKSKDATPFGKDGRPTALFVFAGFVTNPHFEDLDGDGYPELALRSVRPDLIDSLRSASTESIDAELFVYKNTRGTLSKEPTMTWKHSIPLTRFQLASEFIGDLSGDGVSELLVRDAPKRVRVFLVRTSTGKSGPAWTVHDKPLWELEIDEKADVDFARSSARGKGASPAVLISQKSEVLYVRFR